MGVELALCRFWLVLVGRGVLGAGNGAYPRPEAARHENDPTWSDENRIDSAPRAFAITTNKVALPRRTLKT